MLAPHLHQLRRIQENSTSRVGDGGDQVNH